MDESPSIVRLCELQPGEQGDCFVLLLSKERSQTRDGKPYFRVEFRDSRRVATAMIWHDTAWFADCDAAWQVGGCYKLRCRYEQNKFGHQIELIRVREALDGDTYSLADLFPSTRFDVDEMYRELCDIAASQICEKQLSLLVLGILQDHAEAIKRSTAAARYHHAYLGGYLEHTLSVTRTAIYLADKYLQYYPDLKPPLSKSLVVAGAILHDIGKLQELEFHPQGSQYTAPGRLIGHILLGRDLVREYALGVSDLSAECLLRLEHIIVAHQNLPEWGSPIAPHTPEALLVHYADDADAKFHEMVVALESPDVDDQQFTGRDNALRRPIFRGLKQDNPAV